MNVLRIVGTLLLALLAAYLIDIVALLLLGALGAPLPATINGALVLVLWIIMATILIRRRAKRDAVVQN